MCEKQITERLDMIDSELLQFREYAEFIGKAGDVEHLDALISIIHCDLLMIGSRIAYSEVSN